MALLRLMRQGRLEYRSFAHGRDRVKAARRSKRAGAEIRNRDQRREAGAKTKALTVSDYADFCGLPESYLRETFRLTERDAGVEIPYKDEGGTVVSIQR